LIHQGNSWAKFKKSRILTYGLYGFDKNPEEALRLLDELILAGDLSVIMFKYDCICDAQGVYEKFSENTRLKTAREFLEDLIKHGNQWARSQKFGQLCFGGFCFERNPDEARQFLDTLSAQDIEWGIGKKIHSLQDGGYDDKTHSQETKEFLESKSQKGFISPIEAKVEGLIKGIYKLKKILIKYYHFCKP